MSGFDNDIMYAKNADFTQADNQNVSESNGLITNGQLWIGRTAVNAGGTHIDVNTLTAGTGVSIVNGPGTITIGLAGGGTAVEHLTGNTGGQLNPDGSNNFNIIGFNSAVTGYSPFVTGSGSTLTVQHPGTVKWVVNPTANLGTHTTITAALAASSSGDDIFITPGTYTENLTLKAGVNLTAYVSDSSLNGTGDVIISGTCTFTAAGSVTISGIQLQTNSAFLLAVTGSAASIVNLNNCFLNCTNNTGITYTSSSPSSAVNVAYCNGNLGTTGIGIFASSSAGTLTIQHSRFLNSGASTTANTVSAGTFNCVRNTFFNPLNISSTAILGINASYYDCSVINTTALTVGSSGNGPIVSTYFASGTASAISVSGIVTISTSFILCSNTNAITGAGTINTFSNQFLGTSHQSNITTQTGGAGNGLTQGTAPSAGQLGEQIRATVAAASAVSVANSTPTNITSIALTAGVFDITGIIAFHGASITGTQFGGSVNTTSATLGTDGDNACFGPTGPTVTTPIEYIIPSWRVTTSAAITVYLIAFSLYTVGSLTAYGRISATRVG
jgi:hypothetical protein